MSLDLIPITQIKIDKNKWLNSKIKYETDVTIEDLLNNVYENILDWLYNLNEYILITDEYSFNNSFKDMIYTEYLYNSESKKIDTESYDYNYFELKYLEEINNLYLESRLILNHYGLDLFMNKDFMNLFYFIYQNIQYLDESEEEEELEDYLNYNIENA